MALKPLSFTVVVCGSILPEKLGSAQLEFIVTIVDLPTGVNNNCSEPFKSILVLKPALIKSAAEVAFNKAVIPSSEEPCDGENSITLSFHVSVSCSFNPLLSAMFIVTNASFQINFSAGIFNFSIAK